MIVEVKDKKTEKTILDAKVWVIKWSTINDLELLILFKVAFMMTQMNIRHWIWKMETFDVDMYNRLKIEIKIFEINKTNIDTKMVETKKKLEKMMIELFEKEFILDLKEI